MQPVSFRICERALGMDDVESEIDLPSAWLAGDAILSVADRHRSMSVAPITRVRENGEIRGVSIDVEHVDPRRCKITPNHSSHNAYWNIHNLSIQNLFLSLRQGSF
jgi:hypothetical protein